MARLEAEFELKLDKAESNLAKIISNIENSIMGVKTDTLGNNISKSLEKANLQVGLLKNKLETLGNSKLELKDNINIAKDKIGILQQKINLLEAKPTSLKVSADILNAQNQITKLENSITKSGTKSKKIDLDISSTQSTLGRLENDIKNGINSGAKGGSLGIKREFTDLGISQLLKSQIVAGLAVQGIQSAVSGISSALKDGFTKGLNVESQFTSLKTIFKGVETDAKKASQEINKFATETPYSVSQVTDAYIKLKNYGLDSSEKSLRSFGNTASALGKPLNQMVEAVADAGTGQFERLKEFGIKSEAQGDKVKFTFDGITTTVGKNSKEITNYLTTIGETKFAGGMEAQSKTLGGTLSTLGDSFDTVLYKILGVENGIVVQGGVFDKLRNGANFLLQTLSNPAFLSSVDGIIKVIINGFSLASDFISKIDFRSIISQSQNLLSNLQPIFNRISTLFFSTFDKIKTINFSGFQSKLGNIFGKINIQPLLDIFGKIKDIVGKSLQNIDFNSILNGFATFIDGVVNLGTKILESEIFKATIKAGIDLLLKAFESLSTVSITPIIGETLNGIGSALTAISQNQLAVDIITAFGIALSGLGIIGTITGWITGLVAGFGAMGGVLATASTGFVAFFAPVTAGFGIIASAVGIVFGAIASFVAFVGAVPLIIGAILIGLVVLFVLNFEAIKNFTMAFVVAIGTFFTNLGTQIINIITGMWNWIVSSFNNSIAFVTGFVTGFVTRIIGFFTNLYTQVTGYVNLLWTTANILFSLGVSALQNYIANFIINIVNNFNNLKNTITNIITGLWEGAKTKFNEGVNSIKITVETMVNTVKEKFNQLKEGATIGINSMVESAKTTLSKLPQAFTNAANDAKDNLLGILRNIKLPELKFPEIKLPPIPSFATGVTNFGGGMAEFGEKGREMLRFPNGAMALAGSRMFGALPKGTDIFNNSETEKMLKPNFSQIPVYSTGANSYKAPQNVQNKNTTNTTNNNSVAKTVNNFANNLPLPTFSLANS